MWIISKKKKKRVIIRNNTELSPRYIKLKTSCREFPVGLVVRILGFHCHGLGSIFEQGTEILQAAQCGQKKSCKTGYIVGSHLYTHTHTHTHTHIPPKHIYVYKYLNKHL